MAHGDAREGKLANGVSSQYYSHYIGKTVYPALLPLMCTPSAVSIRLNWRPPADLNGLVRFAERRNLVSARVPSHFKRSLYHNALFKKRCLAHKLNEI